MLKELLPSIETIHTVMLEKSASTLIVLIVHAVFPSHYFGVHQIDYHTRLALAVVAQIEIAHDMQMSKKKIKSHNIILALFSSITVYLMHHPYNYHRVGRLYK